MKETDRTRMISYILKAQKNIRREERHSIIKIGRSDEPEDRKQLLLDGLKEYANSSIEVLNARLRKLDHDPSKTVILPWSKDMPVRKLTWNEKKGKHE